MIKFVLNNGDEYDVAEADIPKFVQSVEQDGLQIVGYYGTDTIPENQENRQEVILSDLDKEKNLKRTEVALNTDTPPETTEGPIYTPMEYIATDIPESRKGSFDEEYAQYLKGIQARTMGKGGGVYRGDKFYEEKDIAEAQRALPQYEEYVKVDEAEIYENKQKEYLEKFKKDSEAPSDIRLQTAPGPGASILNPLDAYSDIEKRMYNSWKQTGEFVVDESIIKEETDRQKKKKNRYFLEDLSEGARIKFAKIKDEKAKEQESEKKTIIEQANANGNTLNQLKASFENETKFGTLTKERAYEIQTKAYTIAKELDKQFARLIELEQEQGNTIGVLNNLKKTYSNAEQLAGIVNSLAVKAATGASSIFDMVSPVPTGSKKESDATVYLSKLHRSIEEYNQEFLPESFEFKDVDNMEDFGTWVLDSFINQLPYLAALATPYAIPFYTGTGFLGKLADFKTEEALAKEEIEKKYAQLQNASDEEKEQIYLELEKQKAIINRGDGVKLLTAGIYGLAEGIDAVTDRFLLFGKFVPVAKAANLTTKAGKRQVRKKFDIKKINQKIIGNSLKRIPMGAGVELIQENTTNVIQNGVDRSLGKNVSLFENADETTAQSILFGSGFGGAHTMSTAGGIMLNAYASFENKKKVQNLFKRKNEIQKLINTKGGNLVQSLQYEKDLKKVNDEILGYVQRDIAYLTDMDFEDQKEFFELDLQLKKIKDNYEKEMLDGSNSREQREAIAELRKQEWEEVINKQNALIASSKNKNVNNLQKDPSSKFDTEQDTKARIAYGDFLYSRKQINVHNEDSDLFDNEFEVFDKDLKEIEKFLSNEENKNKKIKLSNGKEITFKEADLIFRQSENPADKALFYAGKTTGSQKRFITYFPDRIVRDAQFTGKYGNEALHEYTHAYLHSLGIDKNEFERIYDALEKQLKKQKGRGKEGKAFLNRLRRVINIYNKDKNPDGSNRFSKSDIADELMVTIGDLIINKTLSKTADADFFEILGFRLKNLIQNQFGKDVAEGFKNLNNSNDVANFIENFQKSVIFNTKERVATNTIEEEKEINESASKSNLQDLLSAEENKAAFIAKTLQDSKGEFPISMLDSKFGQELAPVLENLAKKRFDPIPEDATRVVDENRSNARKQWKEVLLNEIIADVSNNYKPGEQNLDKYVTIRAFQRSNRTAKTLGIQSTIEKGGGGIATDITEAFNIASEQTNIAGESIIDLLDLSQEFKTKILDFEEKALIKAEKALVGKNLTDVKKLKERNKAFAEIFVDRLFNDIATELGKNTKTSDAFSQYLDKNFDPLLNAALTYIDFQMGSGISSDWSLNNPPSKKEFIDYYEGKDIAPGKPASLKSDRKKKLNNAIARAIANEARIKLAEKNPKIAEKFKSDTGIGLASRMDVELFLQKSKNDFIKNLKRLNLDLKNDKFENGEVKFTSFKNKDEFDEYIEYQKTHVWSLVPRAFIEFSTFKTSNQYANKNLSQISGAKNVDKGLKKYAFKKIQDEIQKFKNWGPDFILPNGEVITNFRNSPYKTAIQKNLDKIIKAYNEGKHDFDAELAIRKFNERNNAIGREMFKRFNEAISKDKQKAIGIIGFLELAQNNGEHPIRYLAEVVGGSINPVGFTKGKSFRKLEYEHAMQQVHVMRTLISSMLDSSRDFHMDMEAVLNNFKLIALDNNDNVKLEKAGLAHDMGPGWEVYSSSWLERYFNEMVAMYDDGIDPNGIIHINGKTFAEVYNVNTNGFNPVNIGKASKSEEQEIYDELQAIDELEANFKITPDSRARREELQQKLKDKKLKPIYDELQAIDELEANFKITPESKARREELQEKLNIGKAARSTLDYEFNKILEAQSGVKAEAIFSEDRAKKLAGKSGKFQFFIPYSAEDFIGLTYPTLAKGKAGEDAQQWYKDNIIQPYARGYRDYEAEKTVTLNKWEALKKKIKNTPSNLKKDAVRGFSNEEAIRVYLWNSQNVAPETLAKKDIKALTKYVEGNKELLDFAQQIRSLLGKEGYPKPTPDWLAGTLTTDLIGHINTVSRSKHLKEWSDAVHIVYSKDNLNKLRALYGDKYVEALVNIINRMKSGRNRISGNRLESAWLNYVGSGAVGTIMFFNSRSALLQTISSLNYVNFTFNNPLAVGKAFANQPQFWKDFAFLFNSDYMQSRRKGLKTDIDADEIANAAAMSKNKVRAALSYILKKGYLPTQYADNFAIAFGGASFYRNKVNSLIKQGLSEKEAQKQAFLEFQETSEEAQQSARPDRISMQQASSLGRLILAFANTPMQYARIIKKSSLDLVNGRGDWKENIGKIIWYSSMQNLIFTSLQQALFAMAFDDDDDTSEKDKEKYIRTLNGMADTILRGTGVGGAVISVIKNGILKYIEEQNSKRPDYTKVGLEALNLSPPISSRIKKMINIGRVFTYRQTRKEMRELGYDIDNPYYQVAGQSLSAAFNLPADRLVQKMRNIKDALDDQNETWQRIALALGWPDWQLGIDDKKSESINNTVSIEHLKNINLKSYKDLIKKQKEQIKAFKSSPNKKLKKGVAGVAHKDGTIEIAPDLSPKERKLTLLHEQQHQIDMKSGKLNYDKKFVYYNGNKYARKNGKIMYNGKAYKEGDPDLPWEKRAYKAERTRKFLYA